MRTNSASANTKAASRPARHCLHTTGELLGVDKFVLRELFASRASSRRHLRPACITLSFSFPDSYSHRRPFLFPASLHRSLCHLFSVALCLSLLPLNDTLNLVEFSRTQVQFSPKSSARKQDLCDQLPSWEVASVDSSSVTTSSTAGGTAATQAGNAASKLDTGMQAHLDLLQTHCIDDQPHFQRCSPALSPDAAEEGQDSRGSKLLFHASLTAARLSAWVFGMVVCQL